jgi:TonB family protein
MKRLLFLIFALAVVSCFSADECAAQAPDASGRTQGAVVLSKLSEPAYPPLARQARITGEVDLVLGIRLDGTIESAAVVSGHPMLRQAALESAQQSQFECSSCSGGATLYSLRYNFQLIPLDHTKDCTALTDEERYGHAPPKLDPSQHEVTVFAKVAGTCDPAVERVRSLKCLYLWRCGVR